MIKKFLQVVVGMALIALFSTPASAYRLNTGAMAHAAPQFIRMGQRQQGYSMQRREYRPQIHETVIGRPVFRNYGRREYGYRVGGYSGVIRGQVESREATYVERAHRHYVSYSTAQVSHRHHVVVSHSCGCNCCNGCGEIAVHAEPPADDDGITQEQYDFLAGVYK